MFTAESIRLFVMASRTRERKEGIEIWIFQFELLPGWKWRMFSNCCRVENDVKHTGKLWTEQVRGTPTHGQQYFASANPNDTKEDQWAIARVMLMYEPKNCARNRLVDKLVLVGIVAFPPDWCFLQVLTKIKVRLCYCVGCNCYSLNSCPWGDVSYFECTCTWAAGLDKTKYTAPYRQRGKCPCLESWHGPFGWDLDFSCQRLSIVDSHRVKLVLFCCWCSNPRAVLCWTDPWIHACQYL